MNRSGQPPSLSVRHLRGTMPDVLRGPRATGLVERASTSRVRVSFFLHRPLVDHCSCQHLRRIHTHNHIYYIHKDQGHIIFILSGRDSGAIFKCTDCVMRIRPCEACVAYRGGIHVLHACRRTRSRSTRIHLLKSRELLARLRYWLFYIYPRTRIWSLVPMARVTELCGGAFFGEKLYYTLLRDWLHVIWHAPASCDASRARVP